jgi:hypothetical protein
MNGRKKTSISEPTPTAGVKESVASLAWLIDGLYRSV